MSFPQTALAAPDRILSIEVQVYCGRIASISRIPQDWSLELPAGFSMCRLVAGHFSSSMKRVTGLNDLITVVAGHPTQFDMEVRLTIGTLDGDVSREQSFRVGWGEITLKPSAERDAAVTCAYPPLEEQWLKPYVRLGPRLASPSGEYIVHKQDTFDEIAREFGVRPEYLLKLNPGVDPKRLRVGQKLRVHGNPPG